MEGMIWRVGCYKINPTTPSGQKFFILHMVVTKKSGGSFSFFSLVGVTPDPHHGLGHPEWSHNEHPDVLLFPGVHHQEAGQGRHGDRRLHPEHPGGAGRGRPLHLPQQLKCEL